jgi:hypothetical protein
MQQRMRLDYLVQRHPSPEPCICAAPGNGTSAKPAPTAIVFDDAGDVLFEEAIPGILPLEDPKTRLEAALEEEAPLPSYGINISSMTIVPSTTPLNASLEDFMVELKEALDANMLEERALHLLMSDHTFARALPRCEGTWAEFGVYGEWPACDASICLVRWPFILPVCLSVCCKTVRVPS